MMSWFKGGSGLSVTSIVGTYSTKQGLVVERLRAAILEEQLQPGAWLRLRDLADLLETSTMPVREALQVLAAEGLVTLYPHRGAQVALLSIDELEELYMARLGLEGLAARVGSEQVQPEELERLRHLLPELEQAVADSDIERFLALDTEFHGIHFRASCRPRLVSRIEQLRKSCERYIKRGRMSIVDGAATRRLHRALVDTCVAHDGAEAERIIRLDIDAAVTSIRKHLLKQGGALSNVELIAGHRAGRASSGRDHRSQVLRLDGSHEPE